MIKEAKDKGVLIAGENKEIDDAFNAAMDDDFNTALALSALFGYFKAAKAKLAAGDNSVGADINQIIKTYSLLGLFTTPADEFLDSVKQKEQSDIPQEVIDIAEERQGCRREKNWAKSDELRDKISALGYDIKDSKDGYTITKKK